MMCSESFILKLQNMKLLQFFSFGDFITAFHANPNSTQYLFFAVILLPFESGTFVGPNKADAREQYLFVWMGFCHET